MLIIGERLLLLHYTWVSGTCHDRFRSVGYVLAGVLEIP